MQFQRFGEISQSFSPGLPLAGNVDFEALRYEQSIFLPHTCCIDLFHVYYPSFAARSRTRARSKLVPQPAQPFYLQQHLIARLEPASRILRPEFEDAATTHSA